jgi:hypothetical protein
MDLAQPAAGNKADYAVVMIGGWPLVVAPKAGPKTARQQRHLSPQFSPPSHPAAAASTAAMSAAVLMTYLGKLTPPPRQPP